MDALKNYTAGSDSEEEGEIGESSTANFDLPSLNLAPLVPFNSKPKSVVAVYDDKLREIKTIPKYDELFRQEAGPKNPFKSQEQLAKKNMLSGFVESASVDDFHFSQEMQSHNAVSSSKNPTSSGSLVKSAAQNSAIMTSEPKKTGREKRRRVTNYDASDVEGYTGPWARYVDEKTVAKPDPELQKEMDEIVRKRKLKSQAGRRAALDEQQLVEETTTLHLKGNEDYNGKTFMDVPMFTGATLRPDYVPDRCFPPTKKTYTYKSHTKAVNAIRWFPKSAHLFLSCAMDNKVKLWEVYGNHKLIRTYAGHKMAVRDICFNNSGTEFVSVSFDTHIKLWDTETGQVKNRFHTGHRAFCVKFNPDDDKQDIFLTGMQNKKVIQWDARSGEITQEYDRHLGAVNSITFFDQNRRFCTTSDDKSIRIWEWGIPVDTKLIQNAGMHSIPTMTKAPSEKWIVGQSIDSRVVLFQLIDDKLRFARKKSFRGHNVAGYACSLDFSPDMSYITSGDSEGKVFIWDWRTHKVVSRWKAHENVCISVLWHPHEPSRMISCGYDGDIIQWA